MVRVNRSKLELAMARACMDISDILRTTGMPRPTLNNVVVGRSVRPATVGKVAKALGVDVEELIEKEAS